MINQCLKCHDSNGAQAFATGKPLNVMASRISATPEKPFGTTINYTGLQTLKTTPSGVNITANNIAGGVINVDASFLPTNASYHPVKGKQNNTYASNAQMQPPWNTLATNKTAGNITTANAWGFLITCWDCHAAQGSSGILTGTVTAHGGATTLRSPMYASNNTAAGNLCRVCHFPTNVTQGHGPGSAAASVSTRPQPYMAAACYNCHGSSYTRPPRPLPAQDWHGFDRFASDLGTDTAWPPGAGSANTMKPYGFFRNVGAVSGQPGRWNSTGAWAPRSAPGITAGTATCGGSAGPASCSSDNHGTYAPGGVY
jgi:hypothetical protein